MAALRLLLAAGAEKGEADGDGATPFCLYIAAALGHEATLHLLLEGADANAVYNGRTAIGIARHLQHDACIALLERHELLERHGAKWAGGPSREPRVP